MKKILTVVGARPQFIKCATVSREIRKQATEFLVHTGQHYDDNMSEVFFRELDIPPPDLNLGIGGGAHGAMTGEMLRRIEEVLQAQKPDVVLIYGDTNSTLAGALAAAKLLVPVAHVEAGLRSFNRAMPEEINRVVADSLSRWLFCPTDTAVRNLANEGIKEGVHLVGDVMLDAYLDGLARSKKQSGILARLNLTPGGYHLATVHRQENTDDPARLKGIMEGLAEVGANAPVIWPMHPRTTSRLVSHKITLPPAIRAIEPVSYLDMLALEADARVILTDSGGIQKEASWAGIPCVTMRDETEWVETVDRGDNILAGADSGRIKAGAEKMRARGPKPPASPGTSASVMIAGIILEGK